MPNWFWEHFTKLPPPNIACKATCNHCPVAADALSFKGGGMTSLKRHLLRHGISQDATGRTKQASIIMYGTLERKCGPARKLLVDQKLLNVFIKDLSPLLLVYWSIVCFM